LIENYSYLVTKGRDLRDVAGAMEKQTEKVRGKESLEKRRRRRGLACRKEKPPKLGTGLGAPSTQIQSHESDPMKEREPKLLKGEKDVMGRS